MKFNMKTDKFFYATLVSALIMMLVVLLGNPHSGAFYYHWIPEMFASYFFGLHIYSLTKEKGKLYVWILFLGGAFLTPIVVAQLQILTFSIFELLYLYIVSSSLMFPLIFGFYWFRFWDRREK
jgi:hypothetical protein